VAQCRKALEDLARLLGRDPAAAAKVNLDRSIACRIPDLDAHFHGRLTGGQIQDLAEGDDPGAQIRLTVSSDDLVSLVAGELKFAPAWAAGRVSIKAGFGDLLKLRKLL
jgi:hypothetical protein